MAFLPCVSALGDENVGVVVPRPDVERQAVQRVLDGAARPDEAADHLAGLGAAGQLAGQPLDVRPRDQEPQERLVVDVAADHVAREQPVVIELLDPPPEFLGHVRLGQPLTTRFYQIDGQATRFVAGGLELAGPDLVLPQQVGRRVCRGTHRLRGRHHRRRHVRRPLGLAGLRFFLVNRPAAG
jgi:hypothetical protein